MAQKPVANALTLELEPVVADNLARYLETADEWYAHDYVPFDQGENFAFLGGKDWDPSQVTLPSDVVDALEILLVTKDNLAGYHRELVEHFILEDKWGRWLGRWTAEENLHAIALREYLVVTRNFDPTANEEVRVAHVMRGYRGRQVHPDRDAGLHGALRARPRGVPAQPRGQDRRAGAQGLVGRIAKDEERHEEFFAQPGGPLPRAPPRLDHRRDRPPRPTHFGVVGGDILEYQGQAAAPSPTPASSTSTAPRKVVSDRINAWGLADEPRCCKKFVCA